MSFDVFAQQGEEAQADFLQEDVEGGLVGAAEEHAGVPADGGDDLFCGGGGGEVDVGDGGGGGA